MVYINDKILNAADRAGEALAKRIGFPDWLSSVGAVLQDDGATVIEVGVLPGYPLPRLPARVGGFPVRIVRQQRAVAYDDQKIAQSARAGRKGIPKPYMPGTRYGLMRRANIRVT